MRLLHGLALLTAPALAGCGTTAYIPRQSPRLQVVGDGASMVLVRDGRRYPVGAFGSGLEDAVRGNARAEKEAESYQAKSVAGFVLNLGGSLAAGAGVGVLVGNELRPTPQSGPRIAAISLAVGGVVLSLVGTLIGGSAPPHLWNAINMYNDDLPAPYGFGAPAPGSYGAPYAPYAYPGYRPPQAPYAAPPAWTPRAVPQVPPMAPQAPASAPQAPPMAPQAPPSAPQPPPSAPQAPR